MAGDPLEAKAQNNPQWVDDSGLEMAGSNGAQPFASWFCNTKHSLPHSFLTNEPGKLGITGRRRLARQRTARLIHLKT